MVGLSQNVASNGFRYFRDFGFLATGLVRSRGDNRIGGESISDESAIWIGLRLIAGANVIKEVFEQLQLD